MRVYELLTVEQRQDRTLQQSNDVQLRKQNERQYDADDNRARHPEETLAQLLQMVQERHLMARSLAHPARPPVFPSRCQLPASRVPLPPSRYFIDCRRSSASAASSERGKRLMIS